MPALNLRLPEPLHQQLKGIAQEEGVSINQFITLAVAEKIAALNTVEYLRARAKRGSREKLLTVLDKAADVEPEAYDKL